MRTRTLAIREARQRASNPPTSGVTGRERRKPAGDERERQTPEAAWIQGSQPNAPHGYAGRSGVDLAQPGVNLASAVVDSHRGKSRCIDERLRELVSSHRLELERLVDQALKRELAQLVEQRLAARNAAAHDEPYKPPLCAPTR